MHMRPGMLHGSDHPVSEAAGPVAALAAAAAAPCTGPWISPGVSWEMHAVQCTATPTEQHHKQGQLTQAWTAQVCSCATHGGLQGDTAATDGTVSGIQRDAGTPREASRKSGALSRRSVCPVGAVSKMMRVKWLYSGARMKRTTLEMATSSSTPGGSVSSSSPAHQPGLLSSCPALPSSAADGVQLQGGGQDGACTWRGSLLAVDQSVLR